MHMMGLKTPSSRSPTKSGASSAPRTKADQSTDPIRFPRTHRFESSPFPSSPQSVYPSYATPSMLGGGGLFSSPRTWSRQKKGFVFFGLPFVGAMVASSYIMSNVMQTKYDYNDKRVRAITKKEQLKIEEDRKPLNIQEAYFDLASKRDLDDWDFVRIKRSEEPVFKRS
ncbi:cytochrome c oxidase assembly protein COX16-domain-containing protein [Zopfochytrium polystomum]|nr:cytochrome c oxidase assembly protein COX16-domain-containing protein [Zopfochytrium polystomum]